MDYSDAKNLLLEYCYENGCECCTGIFYTHKNYDIRFYIYQDSVKIEFLNINFYSIEKLQMFLESLE